MGTRLRSAVRSELKTGGGNQMNFSTPIDTIEAAKAFIEELHATDLMFHFEDSPENIINIGTGERTFTDSQASQLRLRVAELYSFDWSVAGEECPIGYALTIMEPGWKAA